MAIRFLSSGDIDGALTINSTVTLNKTNNVISIPSLVDNGTFLEITQTGNETWLFKCESLSGSLDGVSIGTSSAGKVTFDENGQIHSTQLLDVATAGGRLIGESSRGYLSSIHLEQSATGADGGNIRFETATSGTTSGVERLRITDTGAISFGSTGTNYGSSGQVLTSGGNSNPTWTTPTTGDVTGSGAANYVTYWTGTKTVSGTANFQYDGSINLALGSAPTAFGTGVPTLLFKGTNSTNGRAGAIWFKENDGTDTAALYVTDGGDGYGTTLCAYQGDINFATSSLADRKMTITSAGNVGIGTNGPSSKLHVTGAPANGVYLSYLYNSGTHNSSHGLNVQTAANNIATYGLRVNTGGDSNALAVMGNGGVGIGGTPFAHSLSTSANLDLKGNGGIWGYAGATYVNSNAYYDSGWKYKSTGEAATLQVGGSSNTLTFRQAASGTADSTITYTEAFRVHTNGNVGINNTSPAKKLEISSGTDGDGILLTGTGSFATGSSRNIEFSYNDSDTSYASAIKFEVKDNTVHGGQIGFFTDAGPNSSAGLGVLTRAMTIDPSQNVGIGTTAIPTNGYIASGGGWKMLQIGQSSQIAAYGTDDEIAICQNTYLNTSGVFQAITSDVAGSSIILVDGKINFKRAATSGTTQTTSVSMFIDTTGNVGIGTSSPTAKLEIVTAVGADAIRMNYGQSADIFLGFSSANPRILLQDNSNVITHDFTSNANNYIVGSNVGIGTTSPQYKLDVDGQIRAVGIVNIGGLGVAASGALANVDINDTDTNGTSTSYQPNITFKAAGVLKAQIGKLSNSTNYFTAAKNFDGPVNIIASEIHSGHTHSQEYIFGYEPANSGNTWGLNIVDDTNTPNSIYLSAAGLNHNSSIFFGGYTNALCVTRISLNQTLGQWLFDAPDCGTSSTSVKWRKYNVAGYMQNMINFESSGTINNATGSYGTISSDERVKENVVEATSKLDDILSLKVKNFNFIGDDFKQIGLIAQEVEEVFPSWVTTSDTRIYKTHDEHGVPLEEQGELVSGYEDGKGLKVGMEFAVLVKTIQELNAKIVALESRINEM